MDYINHITLNTGHIRKTYPQEVDKGIYFVLKRIYKDMFEGGAEIFDGFTAKATNEPDNGVLITVFGPKSEPISTTGITESKNSAIWRLLHSTSAFPLNWDGLNIKTWKGMKMVYLVIVNDCPQQIYENLTKKQAKDVIYEFEKQGILDIDVYRVTKKWSAEDFKK